MPSQISSWIFIKNLEYAPENKDENVHDFHDEREKAKKVRIV